MNTTRLGSIVAMLALVAGGCSHPAPSPNAPTVAPVPVTPQTVLNDINNAFVVLKADVPLIPGLAPDVVASVMADVDKGLAEVQALSAETPSVQAASALQQAEGYLNSALAALPAVLPPPYNLYAEAAAAIIPTIEVYIASINGQAVAAMAPPARAHGMSPSKGSAILKAQAHKSGHRPPNV